MLDTMPNEHAMNSLLRLEVALRMKRARRDAAELNNYRLTPVGSCS